MSHGGKSEAQSGADCWEIWEEPVYEVGGGCVYKVGTEGVAIQRKESQLKS
jgi:hypothetical protein